jgi:hypothetical protein
MLMDFYLFIVNSEQNTFDIIQYNAKSKGKSRDRFEKTTEKSAQLVTSKKVRDKLL